MLCRNHLLAWHVPGVGIQYSAKRASLDWKANYQLLLSGVRTCAEPRHGCEKLHPQRLLQSTPAFQSISKLLFNEQLQFLIMPPDGKLWHNERSY